MNRFESESVRQSTTTPLPGCKLHIVGREVVFDVFPTLNDQFTFSAVLFWGNWHMDHWQAFAGGMIKEAPSSLALQCD